MLTPAPNTWALITKGVDQESELEELLKKVPEPAEVEDRRRMVSNTITATPNLIGMSRPMRPVQTELTPAIDTPSYSVMTAVSLSGILLGGYLLHRFLRRF